MKNSLLRIIKKVLKNNINTFLCATFLSQFYLIIKNYTLTVTFNNAMMFKLNDNRHRNPRSGYGAQHS